MGVTQFLDSRHGEDHGGPDTDQLDPGHQQDAPNETHFLHVHLV